MYDILDVNGNRERRSIVNELRTTVCCVFFGGGGGEVCWWRMKGFLICKFEESLKCSGSIESKIIEIMKKIVNYKIVKM